MALRDFLIPYSNDRIDSLLRHRPGETRVGDHVAVAGPEWRESLKKHTGRHVVLGISEDIGVRANLGRPGAHSAWQPALAAFLNQLHNAFFDPADVMVLGEVRCGDLMKKAEKLNPATASGLKKLRDLVAQLDERVSAVIEAVVAAGKVPLVVGGGHNNAYGIIRGAANARKQALNVINCDPHLDFRACEGRHSGNSFRYAFNEGWLGRYAVFGMHEQYNNADVLEAFAANPARLWFHSFESVFVRQEKTFQRALNDCIGFVKGGVCGVEIDLDAVTNMPASARTSSGIPALKARQYVHRCAGQLDCAYLHIAEGAPVLAHIRADLKTGKFIAYLLTDFLKTRQAMQLT